MAPKEAMMTTTVGTEQNELLGKADRYLAGGGLGLFTLPLYRFAAREHLLGVEFPSAGFDAGGSEQNHSNQKRCKEFGPISSLERRLVSPIRLNGGPQFKFTEAISFVVNCETQEEVDEFWEKLSAGGQKIQCGWLKDRYGV